MENNKEEIIGLNAQHIQHGLTIGYLMLLIIGLLMDSIIYGSLGIDILHYSSVFDLLVSPLATLLTDLRKLILISFFVIGFPSLVIWLERTFKEKAWYQKRFANLQLQSTKKLSKLLSLALASFLFTCGIFIGISMTTADKLKEKIENKTYDLTHSVTFRDGSENRVLVTGQNTQYLFYVSEGSSEVSISPILTNIKKLVLLEDK